MNGMPSKLFFVSAVLVHIGCFTAIAQDAQTVYRQFQERYLSGESLRVVFRDAANPHISGSLTVKRGNRFILEAGGRTIHCNGSTLWNYHAPTAKVIISNYSAVASLLSPEKIFLNFPTDYKPTLERSMHSSGEKNLTLTLTPRADSLMVESLAKIVLRLAPSGGTLREVEVSDGTMDSRWIIESIDPDFRIENEAFEPVYPEGTTEIDLR